jgi:DNA-binding MarR family transcriptional regulator
MSLTPDIGDAMTAGASDGVWMSVSELAARKNVTKQTISEIVSRLVDAGKLQTRPGKGKAKLVNVAEYDRVRGETTDLAREQGAETKSGAEKLGRDPTFTQHQATRAGYEAELKRLDLEERIGKLRRIEDIEQAAVRCGEAVVRVLEDKVLRAEELASAVAKDGVLGARKFLKDCVFAEREAAVKAFAELAAGDEIAPATGETDPQ